MPNITNVTPANYKNILHQTQKTLHYKFRILHQIFKILHQTDGTFGLQYNKTDFFDLCFFDCWKYSCIISSFFKIIFCENKLIKSANLLLFGGIKSINSIQKYTHIIES